MNRRALTYLGAAVILISVVLAVSMYYKPHRSVKQEAADFRLPASELAAAFSSDEARATGLYAGKIIEVHGQVREMTGSDGTIILLIGDAEGAGVRCYLQPNQEKEITPLQRGAPVRIKGVCNGMLLEVMIDKAIILDNE